MARISDYSGEKSPTPKPQSKLTIDPYYVINPVTGLSPAQEEAKRLQAEAQNLKMNPFEAPQTNQTSSSPAQVPAQVPAVTASGKKKIGEGKWKHPVLGYTYIYDIYDDGTSSLQDWFNSIGGESNASVYVPGLGYRQPVVDASLVDPNQKGSVNLYYYLPGFRLDRKSTRLNSSHVSESRMPSSA